jgi:hypothetical protein
MDRQPYYRVIDTVDLEKIKSELSLIHHETTYALQGECVSDSVFKHIVPATNQTNAWERQTKVTAKDLVEFHFALPYTNSLLVKYNLAYSRVMILNGKTCYTYHKDFTKRVHIPIETNDNNFFVMNDEVFRLPADGSVYEVDTTNLHTFVNASTSTRTHIVGTML